MKKNMWGRRFAAAVAGGALAISASSVLAVELANITVENGAIPETNLPNVFIPTGQSTANFFVEAAAGVGVYPVRIGNDASNNFHNGVLLGTISENHGRFTSLGQPWYVGNSVGLADAHSTSPVTNGQLRLIVDGLGGGNYPGTTVSSVANANMSAAYFPYSEGWIGGTTRSSANGGPPNQFSSFSSHFEYVPDFNAWSGVTEIFSGRYRVRIPGVDDSRRQGLVFANHAKNEDNYASVAPAVNGDGYIITTHGSNTGAAEADPFAFVYIPFGTSGVTMASVHGASGQNLQPTVMNSSGSNFTVVREGEGQWRLSIPGQSPTSGTLLLNTGGIFNHVSGGNSSTSQHLITYQASGNDWIIQSTDIGSGNTDPPTPPFPQTPTADRGPAFQFAFMPFSGAPTAPGATPAVESFKNKVFGYNVNVIEYDGSQNEVPALGGSVTSGTAGHRFQFLRQNRGDFGVAVDGAFLSNDDGIYFASVSQGYRDNSLTSGEAAYGMIAAGDGGGGWEFATHIADPGLGVASSVEFNVNFSAVFFGNDTPFQKGNNVAQSGGALTLSLPGVNTLNDGVLVAQVNGNNDDYAIVAPAVDGSNWSVTTYDNNTAKSNMNVNWLYLPYTADNLVAGRVSANGTVLSSTNPAEFTLVKESTGSYLLTIPGKTPTDGTLLLNGEATDEMFDNVFVYEAAGSSFRILSVDQVSYEEKSSLIFPALEDSNFSFAFIDHNAPPTLGGGSFLEADFNMDGNVDGNDLTAWKNGFGTGSTKGQGDADGNGVVDGADFLTWQRQFGTSPTVGVNAAAVPEPTALGLAVAAGLGLVARRRR
jgi:hypothetical protein